MRIISVLGRNSAGGHGAKFDHKDTRRQGRSKMARFQVSEFDGAALGEAGADVFYELGMMYSVGRSVPTDFVSAHKWFNIAALKGNTDAIRLRRELAEQMSEAEIATAQRAARAWLRHQ
jgi:TPR repeat protein